MIRLLFFLLLLSNDIMAQNLSIGNPLRFLALGDSYTIGQSVPADMRWPDQLSDSLNARGIATDTLTIIATTGWRTDHLLNAIKNKHLADRNYNLVSLLIGVNNQYQGRPFSQHVTEFPQLLDSAINYAGGDLSHVFVVSIPDYAYTPFGQQSGEAAQISIEIDQYNNYNKHVADSLGVTYFDITPISRLGLQNPSYVANDGLHPSGIQYREWVKLMLEEINIGTSGSVSTASNSRVEITPNPATDEINLHISGATSEQSGVLQLYSLIGQPLLRQTFSGNTSSLSVRELPDGIYILMVTANDKRSSHRILKQTR